MGKANQFDTSLPSRCRHCWRSKGGEVTHHAPDVLAVLQSQEHPCPPHPQFTRGNRSPLFLIRPAIERHLACARGRFLQICADRPVGERTHHADLPSPPSSSLSGVNRPCLLEIVPQVRRLISGAAQFALRMQQAILLGLLLPLLARRSTAQSLSVNDLLKMSTAISPACRAGEWGPPLSKIWWRPPTLWVEVTVGIRLIGWW